MRPFKQIEGYLEGYRTYLASINEIYTLKIRLGKKLKSFDFPLMDCHKKKAAAWIIYQED